MKKQTLLAFPNANSSLLAKGTSIWALFWQQKVERPRERETSLNVNNHFLFQIVMFWCFSELANQLASFIFLIINFQVGSLYLLRVAREIAYLRGRNQSERAMQDIKNGWLSSDVWTFPCLVMEVSAEQAAAGPCFCCCASVKANSCSPPIAPEVPTCSWEHIACCLHGI